MHSYDIFTECRADVDNNANLKENKLLWTGPGRLRQIETPVMCILRIGYPCFAFSFDLQQIRKIRITFASILKHL